MSRLHDLYSEQGQSPWLDNLKRSWIVSGELQGWVDRGARGITSNPSIFQKAMTGTAAYDEARRIGLPGRMLWYQFRPYLAYFKVGRSQDVIDLAEATIEGSKVGGKFVEETFYWQGNALASLGDVAGALKAYEQALSVNENFYYAQWAIDSING